MLRAFSEPAVGRRTASTAAALEKEKIHNFPSPVKRPRSGTSYFDISIDGFSVLCPCCLTLALVICPKRLIVFSNFFFLDFLPIGSYSYPLFPFFPCLEWT